MDFTKKELDQMALDMEKQALLCKCPCGEPMTKADYDNAGLCVRCWNYDVTVNYVSTII